MIFYFSGTGNTKWAASKLASATHEDLISIAPYMRADDSSHTLAEPFILKENERLGFVFPVHGWRVPKLVREFIGKMKVQRAEPDAAGSQTLSDISGNSASADASGISASAGNSAENLPFAFCVCTAGDSIGLTIENLNEVISQNPSLQALGITKVSSSYSLIMPESYVGLPFMDVDPKEKEIWKKSKSAQELAVICEEIFDRKEGVNRLVKGPIPWFFTKVVGGFFENVLITDKRFHVEKDKCVKCGICANVCPVGDIKGGHGEYPEWLHHKDCLTCFTCYHHCPHHAIEFGKQTQKKGQYYF
ncbi:EFR1 family ferrodoxin [Segatella copri]|uniref:EFR1 family ferrodoxin n=1 Tax=Segatella copri TaxID=165179 RepID=UPI001932149F|nr:EFR1 family ferrodoxin [Segatella copri]MBM0130245.1 ferredoxin [Segatella copri]